jgi:hypothetical protein
MLDQKRGCGVYANRTTQRNLNNAFAYDLVPSPSVLVAALKAARRVNDYPTAVRVFEGKQSHPMAEMLAGKPMCVDTHANEKQASRQRSRTRTNTSSTSRSCARFARSSALS